MIIPVTYSAQWYRVAIPYSERNSLYTPGMLTPKKTSLETHWYSILNSVALVVLLTGIVAIILYNILNNDLQTYNDKEDPVCILLYQF